MSSERLFYGERMYGDVITAIETRAGIAREWTSEETVRIRDRNANTSLSNMRVGITLNGECYHHLRCQYLYSNILLRARASSISPSRCGPADVYCPCIQRDTAMDW